MEFKYFTYEEFDSKDSPGSGKKHMSDKVIQMLDEAREIAGVPFKINSGYRTKAHNKKVGGVPGSSHTLGLAVDIACADNQSRHTILLALIQVGFNRIGISNTFIHVDIDTSKPSNRIWTY